MTPVKAEVVQTVLLDSSFWIYLKQLIKTVKPLVDAIGDLESHDVNLADCMLELIRCSREMIRIKHEDSENEEFYIHAYRVFNRRFHSMNTSLHSLALFLHPMCRTLAVTNSAKGRPLEFMIRTALEIAKKWNWTEEQARLLIEDINMYYVVKAPFIGGRRDGLDWWESLPVSAKQHPIKKLAIVILSIVPHSAEVERVFSALGGIQTVKQSNLAVNTLEKLGKCRNHYARELYERDRQAGKSKHRKHGHMHTREDDGVDMSLVEDLERTFTWTPPLHPTPVDASHSKPESFTSEEVDEIWDKFEKQLAAEQCLAMEKETNSLGDVDIATNADVLGHEILEENLYSFTELEKVNKGMAPQGIEDVVEVVGKAGGSWSIEEMMSQK